MSEYVLPILGIVVGVIVVGFFAWERNDMAQTIIEAELRFHGATDVAIEREWEFDRDTLTYGVTYTDRDGRRQGNTCKISRRRDDSTVYWSTPLGEPEPLSRRIAEARRFR